MARIEHALQPRDERRPLRCRPPRASSWRGVPATLGELIAAVYDAAGPGASARDVVRLLRELQSRAARTPRGATARAAC